MARRPSSAGVEIPIAPMLDMAFNLLAFFVMTFNPAPMEVQYSMNLLPGQPQAKPDESPSDEQEATSTDIPASLRTLTTNLHADSAGRLAQVTIGELEIQGMAQLRARVKQIKSDPDLPFDQALIQADPALHYGELMQVIDIFHGEGITKISFSELDPDAINPGPAL